MVFHGAVKDIQIIMPWCDLQSSHTQVIMNTGQNNNKHVKRPYHDVSWQEGLHRVLWGNGVKVRIASRKRRELGVCF